MPAAVSSHDATGSSVEPRAPNAGSSACALVAAWSTVAALGACSATPRPSSNRLPPSSRWPVTAWVKTCTPIRICRSTSRASAFATDGATGWSPGSPSVASAARAVATRTAAADVTMRSACTPSPGLPAGHTRCSRRTASSSSARPLPRLGSTTRNATSSGFAVSSTTSRVVNPTSASHPAPGSPAAPGPLTRASIHVGDGSLTPRTTRRRARKSVSASPPATGCAATCLVVASHAISSRSRGTPRSAPIASSVPSRAWSSTRDARSSRAWRRRRAFSESSTSASRPSTPCTRSTANVAVRSVALSVLVVPSAAVRFAVSLPVT